uniref:Glycolipid transfer protein domain-containing protein n=1 Tax=Cucumis melo TaxID=3656 RepID=A0A9I9D2N7_CUCME
MDNGSTPLTAIAESFEGLAKFVNSLKDSSQELRLDTLCEACSLVSVLFSSLGLAFKFAELEYVSKVRDLVEASKKYKTLHTILDADIANDTVKTPGSHSRNLRRVRQGLDLIRALFEQFMSTEGKLTKLLACVFSEYSLREAASTAYTQVCAPYHSWAVRTAVSAGMYTLPTREQLLLKLNETNQSAEKKMRRYINASGPEDQLGLVTFDLL